METLFGLDTDIISRNFLITTIVLTILVVLLSLRNKILLKISLRNIPRRKAQSVLIIFGLMLSSTIIMSALAIGDSVSWSIKNTVMGGLGEVDIAIVDSDVENGFISNDELNIITENASNNQKLDGVIPLIRYTSPIMGEKSEKTVSNSEIVGFDINNTYGFFSRESLKSIEGPFLEEDDLNIQDNETIINRYLSDAIDVNIGDNILLIKPGDKKILKVVNVVESKGLAGGGEASPASALINYNVVKEFTGVEGYNYVGVSLDGGLEIDRDLSKEISADIQLLFINDEITNEIFFALKSPNVFEALKLQIEILSNDTEENNILDSQNSKELIDTLILELENDIPSDEFKNIVKEGLNQAIIGGIIDGLENPELSTSFGLAFSQLVDLNVRPIKDDLLTFGDLLATAITLFFSILGSFSIIVGLLLIFLVFVMLAASRQTEMGIIRAVGTKRRNLIEMFTYEGLVYSVGAAIVGTFLGVIVSFLLFQLFIQGVGTDDRFSFAYNVSLKSINIAFCAGLILTAITVIFSSFRVSRLNIVVAIRGLPQEFATEKTKSFKQKFYELLFSIFGPLSVLYKIILYKKNRKNNIFVFLRWIIPILILIAGAISRENSNFILPIILWMFVFYIKLYQILAPTISTGIPFLFIGFFMALSGVNSDSNFGSEQSQGSAFLWTLGVTLVFIGTGLLLQKFLGRTNLRKDLQKRISMSMIGISMLIFWSLPFDALEGFTGKLDGDIEMFILSGVCLVAAAVWIIMYNPEIIVRLLSIFSYKSGNLKSVVKMSIAYPMSARFRTGLTLAMFSLVIFTLMVFAIIINISDRVEEEPDTVSGGFDIRASVTEPIIDNNIISFIDSNDKLNIDDFSIISSQAYFPARAKTSEGILQNAFIVSSDDEWLVNNRYELTHWDNKYGETSNEVWQSVANNPDLVIVGANVLVGGSFGFQDDQSFTIKEIDPSATGQIGEIDITIAPPSGVKTNFINTDKKVVGVLDLYADSLEFGQDGPVPSLIYMNSEILNEISIETTPYTNFKFRLKNPDKSLELTRTLETVFIENGMIAVSTQELIDRQTAQSNAFNLLFQGFMGLGLFVGISALGVISFRSVVERRQSIGLMRALGFNKKMIQIHFLLESGVIALLGSVIGILLGTIIGWNIFQDFREETATATFSIPWSTVVIITFIAIVFSLLNTIIPARQASAISPSEALRYE